MERVVSVTSSTLVNTINALDIRGLLPGEARSSRYHSIAVALNRWIPMSRLVELWRGTGGKPQSSYFRGVGKVEIA